MAKIGSIFSKLASLLLILLLHLGCFPTTFTSSSSKTQEDHSKAIKKKPSLSHLKKHPKKAISASLSFLKRLLSLSSSSSSEPPITKTTTQSTPHDPLASSPVPPEPTTITNNNIIATISPPDGHDDGDDVITSHVASAISLFPLRNDIFPCTSCGEIFQGAHFLDHHRTTAHAVTELHDGDAGKNVVHMIFQAGWSPPSTKAAAARAPLVQRVLKIHNSQKILSRFEEYRELVKSKAAASLRDGGIVSTRRDDERCMADGNELLRFFCSTFVCNLGANGRSSLCNCNYCSICGIIRSGFSPKLDGIPVYSTSHRAHVSVPDDVEEEFAFMHVKRAVLICRVVAGRVGSDDDAAEKDGGGFDSVVVGGSGGAHARLVEEELLVFNPRAVLPCFIIVYTV